MLWRLRAKRDNICLNILSQPVHQVLRDLEATFFKAQLVPAAHVYVHPVEGKGGSAWTHERMVSERYCWCSRVMAKL